MKSLLIAVMFLFVGIQAKADPYEITTPDQLVNCMTSYIQDWIVAPEAISSWEHDPAYIFAGSYVHASWHTSPMVNYGSLGKMVGPKDDVYCAYETKSDGIPDMSKPGFCKATVASGDVLFDYTTFDRNGKEIDSKKNVAIIVNSKVFCLNIALP